MQDSRRGGEGMRRLDTIAGVRECDYCPARDGERRGPEKSYSWVWFTSLFQEPPLAPKFGLAALLALLVEGYKVFWTDVFSVALILWAMDMLSGTCRALADPTIRFRWSKMIDGIMRLLVICAVAMAAGFIALAIFDLSDGGFDVRGRLSAGVYGLIIVAEFASIMDNASFFYPQLRKIKATVIRIFPNAPPQVGEQAAVVISQSPKEDEDE